MKKFVGSKNVTLSVKMDSIEVMGQSVVDKDMFCVHWSMKGLRGHENTGETENVRAVMGGDGYPVARFPEIFAGEVQIRPRKDGSGYEALEFEFRVSQPALHKKDEKVLGKAIINIFEKVPTVTPGQPYSTEQTVSLAKDAKDGSAVAHVKLTFQTEDQQADGAEAAQPTSPVSPEPESHIVLKTPPSTPVKDAGSESGSTSKSDAKDETTSKKSHRKRRSSNSAAMAAAALKKKEEEMKEKEAKFEEEKKQLNEKIVAQETEISELKKASLHLENRVKELEQAKEQTDVEVINPREEKMQEDLRRLQAENEVLQEQKATLTDEKDGYATKIVQLTQQLDAANQQLEEMKNGSGATSSDDAKDKELALLKEQLADLRAELGKKSDGAAATAPAQNNMVMQGIFAAVGAVLGIIIGHFI